MTSKPDVREAVEKGKSARKGAATPPAAGVSTHRRRSAPAADQEYVEGNREGDLGPAVSPARSTAATVPQRLIAIDWSGRMDVAGQRRHIWAGVWTASPRGGARPGARRGPEVARGKPQIRLDAGRTRDETAEWLLELARETPRMVVSVDCCFSYPAWFLAEHGCATVFDFWKHVAAGHGERWLAREMEGVPRDERFWGKPHKRPAQFSGEGYRRMMRLTDWDNKIAQAAEGGDPDRAAKMRGITPKSPFQIGGSGSVGTGSLRAIPLLQRLHEGGFRVWPFEDAALDEKPRPLLVEMYTRLMTGPVAKSNQKARAAYLALRRKSDPIYASLPRGVLAKALASEDAFDALVSTFEMVRHASEFSCLHATSDADLLLEGITWTPGVDG